MVEKPATRDYVNDHPACRASTQASALDGAIYREAKGSDAFEALLRSVRKGDIVRVYRPFNLAPAKGSAAKKRRVWAQRADRIKKRGGCLVSVSPPLSGAELALRAYEEIASGARAKAGVGKKGRPKKVLSEPAMRVAEKHWPPRKGVTWEQAWTTINELIAPEEVSINWLRENVK